MLPVLDTVLQDFGESEKYRGRLGAFPRIFSPWVSLRPCGGEAGLKSVQSAAIKSEDYRQDHRRQKNETSCRYRFGNGNTPW